MLSLSLVSVTAKLVLLQWQWELEQCGPQNLSMAAHDSNCTGYLLLAMS